MRAPAPREFVVLLLQPELDDRTMYLEFFHHEGIATLCPKDAVDALSLATKADVIVTGILLPGQIDGLEFIAKLRADGRTAHIPVVVLTACAWITERRRVEESGCDLFLSKPCFPADLLQHLRRVLQVADTRSHGVKRETQNKEAAPIRNWTEHRSG